MKKRFVELDYMNVFLCLLVVFIHVFGKITTLMNNETVEYIISKSILRDVAFVVQGFLFLSGLKLISYYKNKKFKYIDFLVRRLSKVFIPYIIAVVSYFAIYFYYGYYDFNKDTIISEILLGNVSAQFYFIVALIQFYILMPLWILLVKINKSFIIFTLSIFVWVLFMQYSFRNYFEFHDRIFVQYIPYWVLGCIAGSNYKRFKEKCEKSFVLISAVFIIFAVLDGTIYVCLEKIGADGFYSNVVHMIYCLSAVLFCYTFSSYVFSDKKMSFITSSINEVSYDIYLWHCLALSFIDKILKKLDFPFIYQCFLFRFLSMYIIIFVAAITIKIFRNMRERNLLFYS